MDLNESIKYGLERLSDVFKSLLWEKAKVHGISPIQIQLLIFVNKHHSELCNITHLSKEFNLTKPTVSDAVKVLHNKGYLEKDFSSADSRSYTLFATPKGKKLIESLNDYAFPFEHILNGMDTAQLASLYSAITELISKLNEHGIIQVQRTCFACRFYEQNKGKHYCNFLKKPLKSTELRLDCPEFEEKNMQ